MKFEHDGSEIQFDAVLYPFEYSSARGQSRGVSETGKARVYDRGAGSKFIRLVLRLNDHARLADIRDFIDKEIIFAKYPFLFTPDPDHNAGNGIGGPVRVRYWSSNLMENQAFYHRYEYEIVLRIENELIGIYADDMDDVGYLGGPL